MHDPSHIQLTTTWPDHTQPADADVLLNGLLDYYPHAIPATLAGQFYQQLHREIPWCSARIMVYGREQTIPRLQSWHGDPDSGYSYSGKALQPLPWTPTLIQLRDWLNQRFSARINAVLCNLYRNGQDCMGWHADDEPELGLDAQIWSLSFGAERDFAVRRRGETRQQGVLPLAHGSLLHMKAGMQQYWQHSLPRRAGCQDMRINLTFRQVLTVQNRS